MASTVPPKSQSLHTFTLPWNKDGHSTGNHQRRRRSIKSPSRRPISSSSVSRLPQSPLRDSVSATPPRLQSPLSDSTAPSPINYSPVRGDLSGKQSPDRVEPAKPSPLRNVSRRGSSLESEASDRSKGASIEHRRKDSRNLTLDGVKSFANSTNSERVKEKLESKSKATEVDLVKRSKILIKIPCKSSNIQEEPLKVENNGKDHEIDEVQEEEKINNNNIDEETKTWNLRPRKPIRRSLNINGGSVRNNGLTMSETNKAPSPFRNPNNGSGKVEGSSGGREADLRGVPGVPRNTQTSLAQWNTLFFNPGSAPGGSEKKRKLSITVPLTREEIEEDIFALTGSRPRGRPKKRAKNIQRQVDFVFPGLGLVLINADSYKVSENSLKG